MRPDDVSGAGSVIDDGLLDVVEDRRADYGHVASHPERRGGSRGGGRRTDEDRSAQAGRRGAGRARRCGDGVLARSFGARSGQSRHRLERELGVPIAGGRDARAPPAASGPG